MIGENPTKSKDKKALGGFTSKILQLKELSILIALLFLCTLLSILSPYFLELQNIINVLKQFSIIAILAVGEALVIITGGIDLSVGTVLGLTGSIAAALVSQGVGDAVVFIGTLALGTLIGLVNGVLVTKARINAFIVTLGMMSIARGSTLLITGGLPISFDSSLAWLGNGYIGKVPVPVVLMFLIALVGHIFATRTRIGRNIFAVGNNERAAKLSGIRVDNIRILVFIISGLLCALSGMVLAGNLMSADPSSGLGYELDVIAAVVIGGASLAGGEGSILGVILGAALMGVLRNGFVLLGISAYWQIVTIGVVIIAAVGLDSLRRR